MTRTGFHNHRREFGFVGKFEVLLKEIISVSGLKWAKRNSLDSVMTMVKIDS